MGNTNDSQLMQSNGANAIVLSQEGLNESNKVRGVKPKNGQKLVMCMKGDKKDRDLSSKLR